MSKPKNKECILNFRFTQDEMTMLREYAARHNMTMTNVVRRGLMVQYEMEKPVRSS